MRSLLLALLLVVPAAAQPLVTDRPDFTESAVVLPAGTVQIESGITYTESDPLSTTTGPELLVRWGFADRFELRLQSPDFVRFDGGGGVSDPALGLKVELGPVAAWDLAVIAVTSVPLGDSRFGAEDPEPLVIVTAGRDLGGFSLGTQIEGTWDSASEDVLVGGTLVGGASLTDTIGGFAEVALGQEPIGPVAVLLHGGFMWAVADLVQLDLHVGVGATETAPDVLIGAGLSLRR